MSREGLRQQAPETAPRIRAARPDEAAALTAIALAAKRHWGYPEAWLAEWATALTITPAQIAAHTVLLAEDGGRIAGFTMLVDGGPHWELEHLWVDPGSHGRGIGSALLAAAVESAGRRRPGVLRVVSDPFATGFYERSGARQVGAVPAPVLGTPRELPVLELPVPAG